MPELDLLRAGGVIVHDSWVHVDDAVILRVAASDVDHVTQILGPRLPRRLCVVQSRYRAEDLARVRTVFAAPPSGWLFEAWGSESLDDHGQPFADACLLRVTEDLANWVDSLPDGLVILEPTMTPA